MNIHVRGQTECPANVAQSIAIWPKCFASDINTTEQQKISKYNVVIKINTLAVKHVKNH